jgi:hypothetical protein
MQKRPAELAGVCSIAGSDTTAETLLTGGYWSKRKSVVGVASDPAVVGGVVVPVIEPDRWRRLGEACRLMKAHRRTAANP